LVLFGALLLLASCSGVGGQSLSRTEPNHASCDKAPSQRTIAEHQFCENLSRGI